MLQEFNNLGWVSKICPVCHGKGEEKISNRDVLLLIDVQNGFRNEHTEKMMKELGNFIFEYRFPKILATKFLNFPNSLHVKELNYKSMMTPEQQEIIPEIKPFVSAVYLKNKYNCVDEMFLNQLQILNEGEFPSQVLVAGVDMEACVLATAAGLFDKGIRPILLADFLASTQGEENHQCGLKIMETMFGKHNFLKLG